MRKRVGQINYRLPLLPPQSGSFPVFKTRPSAISGGKDAAVPTRAGGTSKTKPIYMRPIRPGRLAMACLFMAVLSAPVFSYAQTNTICGTGPTPAGWVTVSFGPLCDSSGNRSRTVQKIDGLPAGATVTICDNDMPPPGWATVSWGDSTASIGRHAVHRRTVENLNGLPPGTTLTVCGYDLLPTGWAVDNMGGTCATVNGTGFRSMTVRKL